MKRFLTCCILALNLWSCKNENETSINTFKDPTVLSQKLMDSLDHQALNLVTDQQKQEYLEETRHEDQSVRKLKSLAELEANKNPEAFQKALNNFYEVDAINRYKIRMYLKEYGHPQPEKFSKEAVITPWLVVHHASLSYREQFYPEMKNAYDNGYIDVDQFSLYLGRTDEMKYVSRFKMPSPYQPEEEIDSLITLLNYDH